MLVVAVALTISLLLLSIVLFMLDQSESDLRHSERLVQIQFAMNRYQETFFVSAQSMALYFMRRGQSDVATYRSERGQANEAYNKLAPLVERPEQREVLERIRKLQIRLYDLFDGIDLTAQDGSDPTEIFTLLGVRQQVNGIMAQMIADMRIWKQRLDLLEADSTSRFRSQRRICEGFVWTGMFVMIVASFALALYYSKNVTRRLQLVMDNAVRLGSNRQLLPRLSGEDEIAHLDEIFRNMASALEESRQRESAVLENAIDVICSIDSDNKFTQVNKASLNVWGYSSEELLGKRFAELMSSEDTQNMLDILRTVSGTNSTATVENRIIKKDRSPADMMWSISWSPDKRSYFCVVHDITERKMTEQLKREFIQMVSHDLRTPLCSIQVSLDLLQSKALGELSNKAETVVNRSSSDVKRLIELIDGLLDLEKLEAGKVQLDLEVVKIDAVVTRSVNAVLQLAETSGIRIESQTKDIEALADSSKLVQVLVNLLSNAIKFSAKGSTITVEYEEIPGFVEVRVSDQGRGIPESHISSIFNRFEQVSSRDQEKGGKGLGLAICKSIIEAHNGEIGVRSREGEGSCFWFRIPQPE